MLRRLAKNSSILLSGNAGAAVLGLLSVIVTARALGAEGFGLIALVQSYVLAVDGLLNFQAWRTVIKYGAGPLERKESQSFADVLLFGITLDVGSALLGAVAAFFGTWAMAALMDWDQRTQMMAMVYSTVILFHISGTPVAVLRLFDRFSAFAVQRLVSGVIRLGGALLAWWLHLDVFGFLIVWWLGHLAGHLVLLVFGWQTIRRAKELKLPRGRLRGIGKRHVGIVRFALVVNLTAAIRTSAKTIDEVLVGKLLGMAELGLYRIAKQYAGLLAHVHEPLNTAIYPDLARLRAIGSKPEFVRGLWVGTGVAIAISIPAFVVAYFGGEFILGLTAGEEYIPAARAFSIYVIATGVMLSGFGLVPALLSLGRPTAPLIATILSTLLYFVVIAPMTRTWGVEGASWAYVLSYASVTVYMAIALFASLRRWRPDEEAESPASNSATRPESE